MASEPPTSFSTLAANLNFQESPRVAESTSIPVLQNQVDPAFNVQCQMAASAQLDAEKMSDDNTTGNDVDSQSCLDNHLPFSSALSVPAVPRNDTTADNTSASPRSVADEAPRTCLGLPPPPLPQEKPTIHPNHNPGDDIPSSHQLSAHNSSNTSKPYVAQPNNRESNVGVSLLAASTSGMSLGAGSHSPHSAASFQQSSTAPADIQGPPPAAAKAQKNCCVDNPLPLHSNDDTRWGIYVQEKYDWFLHDERIYVTEGLWDRFPYGSRLLVGNLPTERVTKRDLFHIFHSYGKLVQISIKQGYGFIQFLEAASCRQALKYEQEAIVRGRKVHLEISKPRRSIRPAPTPTEPSRAAPPHRSKSPNCSQGGAPSNQPSRSEGDCYGWSCEPRRLRFSDFRDGPSHCQRDDYRPPRSLSPRGYRSREEYFRDQTPEPFDQRERRRSRSPCRRGRRYRGPSPQGRATRDSDANLSIPRCAPREVPDVQILVIEELDRNFVYHVETRFWNRGLRVDVLALGSQISLDAAVKRQASEGVLAVTRLSRPTQLSGKIPLQVFNRSLGADNIRSNGDTSMTSLVAATAVEYPALEPSLAADIVFRAQFLQRNNPNVPLTSPPFGVPISPTALLPPPVAPALTTQPHLANAISHLDGAALQSLLAAIEQQCSPVAPAAQQPFPATDPRSTPDLASFLSAATRQHLPQNSARWPLLQQQLPLQGRTTTAISDRNFLSLGTHVKLKQRVHQVTQDCVFRGGGLVSNRREGGSLSPTSTCQELTDIGRQESWSAEMHGSSISIRNQARIRHRAGDQI